MFPILTDLPLPGVTWASTEISCDFWKSSVNIFISFWTKWNEFLFAVFFMIVVMIPIYSVMSVVNIILCWILEICQESRFQVLSSRENLTLWEDMQTSLTVTVTSQCICISNCRAYTVDIIFI